MGRCLRGILVTLLSGMFPLGANAGPRGNPTHDGQIDFGAQLLHLNDGCAAIHGNVTAGTFFDDLKRIDNGGRLEFRKRGKIVTQYPESLTTFVHIGGDPCASGMSNSPSAIFEGNSYSLKLEVYWKHDMQMRPAALMPAAAHCIGYSSITFPGENLTTPSITCQMTVNSKGVPLEDHLIVSIITADGRPLTRISAAP